MKPDDLKAGNPALSDEHVQFGLRRAGEIFAKHTARGAIEGQPRRPGTLQLSDYQLAAIIAGAYADGAAAADNLYCTREGCPDAFAGPPHQWGGKPNPYPGDESDLPNGQFYAVQADGHKMLCNADGTRSIFDDVDQ